MRHTDSIERSILEQELRDALRWEPAGAVASRMDRAVIDAMAARHPHQGWSWTRGRLILMIAGAVLLVGAASAVTLLQQAADLMPGSRVAYERAERLNLAQAVGGYTVTLERGYIDPNQLVLAFQVDGPDGSSLAVPRADVTDVSGRSYLDIAGGDVPAEGWNSVGSISQFQVPPNIGQEVELTARIESLVAIGNVSNPVGPWVFHFRLPVHPAAAFEPRQTISAAGVPITLSQVRVTATAVRVQLDVDVSAVLDEQWSRWGVDATLNHNGGAEQELLWAPLPPEWTGQPKADIGPIVQRSEEGWVMVRQTFAGTDDPSGHWTLTIQRLNGYDGTGNIKSIEGPWVLTFDIP